MGNTPRRWQTVILAAAFLFAAIALRLAVSSSYAVANSVAIEPSNGTVAPGGNAYVSLSAEPPAASLAAWLIRVQFDPAIVSVAKDGQGHDLCTPLASPAGSASASACEATDTNADGKEDTVVALGGVIFHDTQKGLESKAVLAAITFHGEGSIGQCSPLTIEVASFIDPAGVGTGPTLSNGQICVQPGQPRAWGNMDCSAGDNPVSIADAQKIALRLINLAPAQPAGCPLIKDSKPSVDGTARTWGDMDCSAGDNPVSIADAQKIALWLINLAPAQPAGCPLIGQVVTVS